MVKILLPLSCLLAGLLLAPSGFLLAEKIEEKNRFNACREQDYSFLSLTSSDEERFGSLVVRRENGDTLFLDDWSGQMRQYRNGVLFLLLHRRMERGRRPRLPVVFHPHGGRM